MISAFLSKLLFAFGAMILFAQSILSAQEDDFPRRDAVEVTTREGFSNVLSKLRSDTDEEIRIGYLGGSITAAGSGWRSKSLEWLRERFPDRKIEEINAAIGGTGSDLGVFRLEQDMLRHGPDLLFVEFAVNDGGAQPERIHKAMEGIVRQTWHADPSTDIVFVYTLSMPFLEELQNGKFSRAASAMEGVADHYGIPTIHFGMDAAKREKEGTLIFKGEAPEGEPDPGAPMVFSRDGVHPLAETGHQLYLEAIDRSWPKIEAVTAEEAKVHQLSKPLRPDHWAAAKLVPITDDMLSGDWIKLDNRDDGDFIAKRFAGKMPEMWRANAPGAAISFRFRGSQIGFYDIVGPDGGVLSPAVDGNSLPDIQRIDGYCTYHRLSKVSVASALDPEAVHSVTVTLTGQQPDKREILFEKNREFYDKNAEKYEPTLWHVGSIMLIGDLVK